MNTDASNISLFLNIKNGLVYLLSSELNAVH